MSRAVIAPSLLAGNFANLGMESFRMLHLGADWLHCDVMDGHFVQNITFGPSFISALRSTLPHAFLDCHLMVSHPTHWLDDFKKAGASQLTLHIETISSEVFQANGGVLRDKTGNRTFNKTEDILKYVREDLGLRVGLAVKPNTPVESVFPYLSMIDMILIMTVEPGFGGQKFMSHVLPKVETLRRMCPDLDIQVDGGLAPGETVTMAAKAGANVIVAGSSIFNASDPGAAIKQLRDAVLTHRGLSPSQ